MCVCVCAHRNGLEGMTPNWECSFLQEGNWDGEEVVVRGSFALVIIFGFSSILRNYVCITCTVKLKIISKIGM